MQIEFRENQRLNAESIKLESNSSINHEKLKKRIVNDKQQADIERDQQIYDANEKFKVSLEQHEVEKKKKELEKKAILEKHRLERHRKKAEMEYQQY